VKREIVVEVRVAAFVAALCATAGACLLPGSSRPAKPHVVTFASGPNWPSFVGKLSAIVLPTIGPAKLVCVNAGSPPACPAGAISYGFPGTSWGADRAALFGGQWIWRADVAPLAPAQDGAGFEKEFTLGRDPTGMIRIAAADYAEVLVDSVVVGTTGSLQDVGFAWTAQSTWKELDLTPFLHEGQNVITVIALKAPVACHPSACLYAQAPAGVVFGGSLSY
jgi:hypothetical protein